MSKHTPGPWYLFEKNRLCIESDSGNVALCNLARNSEADALLIAAAPDLFEVLSAARQAIEDHEGEGSVLLARIVASMARATGEQS
jgi:hypothetical protein